jgi:hypothetical protein
MFARLRDALTRVKAPTWLAWALPVFAWAALTYPGYFELHSGFRPIFNLNDLARSLPGWGWAPVIGQPYDWLRGEGALVYWLALLPRGLGAPAVVAIKGTLAASLLMGTLGMYAWTRRTLGAWPGLLASLVYALLPVNLAAVYVRGALSEAVLLGLAPWVLWAAARTVQAADRRPPTAGASARSMQGWLEQTGPLALILAVAFWTQAGLAFWLAALTLVYILFGTRTSADERGHHTDPGQKHPERSPAAVERDVVEGHSHGDTASRLASTPRDMPGLGRLRKRHALTLNSSFVLSGWLVGVLLGLAGLLPVVIRHGLGGTVYVGFFDHLAYIHQLLWSGWGNGPSIAGSYDTLTLQLGLVACGLAVLGWVLRPAVLARSETGQSAVERSTFNVQRSTRLALIATVVIVVLATTLSAPLWRLLPFLARMLTYPWQLLLLAGPWLAWLAGLGGRALAGPMPEDEDERERAPFFAALLALVLLGSYAYLNPMPVSGPVPDAPLAIFGDNEIALLAVEPEARPVGSASAGIEVRWQALRPLANDYTVFVHVVGPDGQVIGQQDTMPQANKLPTTQWRPGQVVDDRYEAALKSAIPARGRLQYDLGWYRWQTGERLRTATDDKVVVER